jgi:ribosomal protein L9
MLAVATFIAVAQQAPPMSPDRPYLLPEANRLPDKNDQMKLNEQQSKKANYEAANVERKKQIADDAARLLQLATELKAEVDKTSKDTLSVNVIRKAETIEKLAKGVKEKMKLTTGAS